MYIHSYIDLSTRVSVAILAANDIYIYISLFAHTYIYISWNAVACCRPEVFPVTRKPAMALDDDVSWPNLDSRSASEKAHPKPIHALAEERGRQ